MNYFITTIIGLFLTLNSILTIPYSKVESAFSKGNATEIMNLGTAKTLISIEGNEGVYSKSQGTQILASFFKENPPKSFSFNFKGKESGASTFAIGKYVSSKEYKVSIKFKNLKSSHRIESITISR
ncbi:DUF4783 domain-containing protein [Brumimicrobium aurantiacum]|uniref:DUF4783 domain-containing protein n=1 Tax=Brumimicrobium aurantiacum TaxID=1737063 RepID=A0A3E1EUU1_9FLAO|nr:DUF4783 domain-containing protein [Brumimicrobium aurantiacum]RFC53298.1 DUF4783 domain-containing protein [Brumimicrobium aurantiacum]